MPENKGPSRSQMKSLTNQVANESKVITSNGNRTNVAPGESTDAQLGGPDLRKAQSRQPPDATRAREGRKS